MWCFLHPTTFSLNFPTALLTPQLPVTLHSFSLTPVCAPTPLCTLLPTPVCHLKAARPPNPLSARTSKSPLSRQGPSLHPHCALAHSHIPLQTKVPSSDFRDGSLLSCPLSPSLALIPPISSCTSAWNPTACPTVPYVPFILPSHPPTLTRLKPRPPSAASIHSITHLSTSCYLQLHFISISCTLSLHCLNPHPQIFPFFPASPPYPISLHTPHSGIPHFPRRPYPPLCPVPFSS